MANSVYADLNVAFGGAGGNGARATPWSIDEALINAASNDVVFVKVKDNDGDFVVTAGMDVGNTNTQGSNKKIRFICYKNWNVSYETWPHLTDMDEGGEFYGGAIDAYRGENGLNLGNPNALWGKIFGNGLADDIITIDGKDSIEFRNFKFYGTDQLVTNACIQNINSPDAFMYSNCKFNTSQKHFLGFVGSGVVKDCWFGSDVEANEDVLSMTGTNVSIEQSIFEAVGSSICLQTRNGVVVTGCFLKGGLIGIEQIAGQGTVMNCTFYGQSSTCIDLSSATGILNEYSNIFNPLAVDDNAVVAGLNSSNINYSDYSLAWSLAGPITAIPWEDENASASFAGPNVIINQDPNINLYTLKAQNPRLLGKPDFNGNRSLIGAQLPDLSTHNRLRTRYSSHNRGWRL